MLFIPSEETDLACTQVRHSLNFAWAEWSWANELPKCSISSSICFLTWESCWMSKLSMLTKCNERRGPRYHYCSEGDVWGIKGALMAAYQLHLPEKP